MEPPGDEPILLKCIIPKTVSKKGLQATDFIRKHPGSQFCHARFTRPMIEGDSLEIRVTFHGVPRVDGQCLLSVTLPEFQKSKAKHIVKQNPFVIDPCTAWISNLKDDDSKKCMQFGLKYETGVIKLRLAGDTSFINFFYVSDANQPIYIDVFFCQYVKSVALRDPLSTDYAEDEPMIYQKRSSLLIV